MSQGTEIATSEGAEGPDDHEVVPRPRAEATPVAGRHRAPDTTEAPDEEPRTGETPRPSTDDAAARYRPAPPRPAAPTGSFPVAGPHGPYAPARRGPAGGPPRTPPGGMPWGPAPYGPAGRGPWTDHPSYPGLPVPRPAVDDAAAIDIDSDEDPRPPGNAAAIGSCILGILALLLSLRPLVFGGDAMSIDTYVALGLAVVGLVTGIAGARLPQRRGVVVVGVTLSALAMLMVGIIPTL